MPIGDWQFWVVSLLAIAASWWLFRGPIGALARRARGRKRVHQRRVRLTIEGERRGTRG